MPRECQILCVGFLHYVSHELSLSDSKQKLIFGSYFSMSFCGTSALLPQVYSVCRVIFQYMGGLILFNIWEHFYLFPRKLSSSLLLCLDFGTHFSLIQCFSSFCPDREKVRNRFGEIVSLTFTILFLSVLLVDGHVYIESCIHLLED